MNSKLTSSMLALSIASLAHAAPTVYSVGGGSSVQFQNYDPTLPDIEFRLESADYGGGSQTVGYRPLVVETGTQCFMPPAGLVEIEAANIHLFADAGMSIDSSTPSWVYTEPACDVGSVLDEVFRTSGFEGCYTCPDESSIYNFDTMGLRYLPIRYAQPGTSDWYYGWVAFEITKEINPSCQDLCAMEDLHSIDFNVVAFAIESAPNTPIITGGGLCEADVNFDAQVDFFDISLFLQNLSNADPSADLNNDGNFDFFDISAFLSQVSDPCDL